MYFFLLSYSILGAGIKYIDSAFDEKIFNKKLAMILAPFLGGLWAYTMFINPFSATILLFILLILFKKKIDIIHCVLTCIYICTKSINNNINVLKNIWGPIRCIGI
jgi:hypothetical protein